MTSLVETHLFIHMSRGSFWTSDPTTPAEFPVYELNPVHHSGVTQSSETCVSIVQFLPLSVKEAAG